VIERLHPRFDVEEYGRVECSESFPLPALWPIICCNVAKGYVAPH